MAEAQLKDTRWHIKKKDVVFEPTPENSLGAGSFGEVFCAKWLGNKVAAKRLSKRMLAPMARAAADKKRTKADELSQQEYSLMMSLHHPHIVQLYGVYFPDEPPDAPPVIIMELLNKTLRGVIVKGPLLLLEVLDYSLQITSALCYLHGQVQPVIHRDLTSKNVMLTSNNVCKIVDLGLAEVFDRTAQKELEMRPGNACYMPVEVLVGIGDYDERLDVFSFNIVMLEMAIRRVSQPSTDLLEERAGGLLTPIAETKRRKDDLAHLPDDHPLRPLILRLLKPLNDLPSIDHVHKRLQDLQRNDEVLRLCSSDARKLCHLEEGVEREEINELRSMVYSMQVTLGRSIEMLTQDVTAVKATVEEFTRKQPQICARPCAAKHCLGKCVRHIVPWHTKDECCCEKSGCTEDCEICEQQVQQCVSEIHLHELLKEKGELHHCGREHPCTKMCNEQGICARTPLWGQPCMHDSMRVGLNGFRLRCVIKRPIGQKDHDKSHSCGRQHTCDQQCPLCLHYCELPYGHCGQCMTSTHGPAIKVLNFDGATVINAEGKKMTLSPEVTCDKLCQAAGRGHSHILECACEHVLLPTPSFEQKRRHHQGPRYAGSDLAAHSEFWSLLGPFSDPAAAEDQEQFHRCGAVCPVCKLHEITTFCTENLYHARARRGRTIFVHAEHNFPCKQHKCEGTCSYSWLVNCKKPCQKLHGHHGSCSCGGSHL